MVVKKLWFDCQVETEVTFSSPVFGAVESGVPVWLFLVRD